MCTNLVQKNVLSLKPTIDMKFSKMSFRYKRNAEEKSQHLQLSLFRKWIGDHQQTVSDQSPLLNHFYSWNGMWRRQLWWYSVSSLQMIIIQVLVLPQLFEISSMLSLSTVEHNFQQKHSTGILLVFVKAKINAQYYCTQSEW